MEIFGQTAYMQNHRWPEWAFSWQTWLLKLPFPKWSGNFKSLCFLVTDIWTNCYNTPRAPGIKINYIAIPLSSSLWRQYWLAHKRQEKAWRRMPTTWGVGFPLKKPWVLENSTLMQIQQDKAWYPARHKITATQAFIWIWEWGWR